MNIDSVKSFPRKRWLLAVWSSVWALPACLLLVFACILSWFSYDGHSATIEQEYRFLESSSRIGEADLLSLLRNMEQLLNRIAEERQGLQVSEHHAFDARLAERKRQFPEIRVLAVINAVGKTEFSSNPSLKNFDSSKRDYFAAHLGAPQQGNFYISRPYKTSFGDQSIAFSIALFDAERHFQGVAVAGVDPKYFEGVLSHIKPDGDNSVTTLFNREGDILFRIPGAEKYNGSSIAGGKPFQEFTTRTTQRTRYIGVAASDGVSRIFVLSGVGNSSLGIGVSRKFDEIMAHWWRNLYVRIFMFSIVLAASLFVMNIAYRRHRQVLKSKAFADLLIETGNVIVLGVDAGGRVAIFNQTSERVTGYRRDEVLGRDCSELLAPKRPYPQILQMFQTRHAAEQGPSALEYAVLTKDGHQRTISWQHTIIEAADALASTIFFGVDITERKEYEEQLREARTLADAANQAKGQFLANMSHEIRTPMNSVLGIAQLALKDEINSKQRAHLKKILAAGQHLMGIIEDVLDFSKIEAGKMSLESVNFDLNALLASVGDQLHAKVKAGDLRWVVDLGPRVPQQLCGDALRLRQILINFASNAVKFTKQGRVAILVRELEQDHDSWLLHFEVNDSGIGMSEEEIGHLFQSFHQADNTITRRYGGTGLGLAISKRLIEQMGGKLGVNSEVGKGSSFWFDLRFEKGWEQDVQHNADIKFGPVQNQSEPAFSLAGRKVLVVEDNPFNQQVLEEFLRQAGAQVYFADNGQEALDILQYESIEFILMDVQMPVMDGLEATRRIRADPRLANIPIIATTGNARHENHDACLAAGMNDFIVKPILFTSLEAKMMKLLPTNPSSASSTSSSTSSTSSSQSPEAVDAALPVVDLRIMENLIGNKYKVCKLSRSFIATSKATLNQIEAALDQQDLPLLADLGHRLKSAAKAIGARGFSELCHALEQYKNGGDIEQARAIVVQLRPLLEQIVEEIERQLVNYPEFSTETF